MSKNDQKKMFLEIWEERPHVCDLCFKHLGNEPMAYHFSHILGKGAYPRIKLLKENIMLNHFECHRKWDQGDPSALPGFEAQNKKRQDLKLKYNTNKI